MSDLMDKIIGISVAVLVAAILIPISISELFDANTTGWSATTVTVFELLPVIVVIGIFLIVLSYVRNRESA